MCTYLFQLILLQKVSSLTEIDCLDILQSLDITLRSHRADNPPRRCRKEQFRHLIVIREQPVVISSGHIVGVRWILFNWYLTRPHKQRFSRCSLKIRTRIVVVFLFCQLPLQCTWQHGLDKRFRSMIIVLPDSNMTESKESVLRRTWRSHLIPVCKWAHGLHKSQSKHARRWIRLG